MGVINDEIARIGGAGGTIFYSSGDTDVLMWKVQSNADDTTITAVVDEDGEDITTPMKLGAGQVLLAGNFIVGHNGKRIKSVTYTATNKMIGHK